MASDEATPRACALLCQNALAVLRVATLIGTFLRDGVGFWLVTGCAQPLWLRLASVGRFAPQAVVLCLARFMGPARVISDA